MSAIPADPQRCGRRTGATNEPGDALRATPSPPDPGSAEIGTPSDETLRLLHRRLTAGGPGAAQAYEELDRRHGTARRLAAYGSLAPGRVNHRVVAPAGGTWSAGWVRGHLHASGWGAGLGFPGFEWDPSAPRVAVHLLVSAGLPALWPELDDFEGSDYLRVPVPLEREGGDPWLAYLYVIRASAGDP